MKRTILILVLGTSVLLACKSKKTAATSTATTSTTSTPESAAALTPDNATSFGKVSHKYRAAGCATVILMHVQDGEDLTLIPKDKLPAELDVDGLEIKFNYRTLRMAQPEGCNTGQPAEFTDLSKK